MEINNCPICNSKNIKKLNGCIKCNKCNYEYLSEIEIKKRIENAKINN